MSEYYEQIIGRLYLDIKALEEDCDRYIKRSEELMAVHDELQSLKQKYADLYRNHEKALVELSTLKGTRSKTSEDAIVEAMNK